MKAFLIFLGLAVTCGAEYEPDLRLKFGVKWGMWNGEDFFIPYYMTKTEAIEKGYQLTPSPDCPLPELVLYCPPEKTVCLFFDDETGHICGINIAIRKDEVSDAVFDWGIQGWTDWDLPTENGATVKYVTIQQYYCSREYLKKTPEERIASREENKILPESAIWLRGFNSDLDRLSTSKEELEKHSDYTKQAFIPFMGTHYYYKMTPSTQCKNETMYPWFPLVKGDKVIGTGLITFAKISEEAGHMFESPDEAAVKMIVERGPQCLYDLAKSPGLRTMHIYYINSPWTLIFP